MAKKSKRVFDFYPLEDRVLLSGEGFDGLDGIQDVDADLSEALLGEDASVLIDHLVPNGEAQANSEAQTQASSTDEEGTVHASIDAPTFDPALPLEVVFIDEGVEDADTLLSDLRSDSDGTQWLIVTLSSDQDGINQITETLAGLSGIDAVHLISHGDGEGVQLGNTRLDLDSAPSYAGNIAAWGHSLDANADLLIYGCDLASTESGQDLIDILALVCDCDVAASDDKTGHDDLGGDWILEYTVGDVSTDVAFGFLAQASWRGTLDITSGLVSHHSFDTDASDSAGSNDGTLGNGASIDTTTGTNQVGAGKLELDGSGDYVDLGSHIASYSGLTEGTIAAWVRISDTGDNTIFGLSDEGDALSLMKLSVDAGQLKWINFNDANDDVVVYSTATINDGLWHHVAVTVDATGNKLFIDGSQTSVTYNTGAASNNRFSDDITAIDDASIGRSVRNSTVEDEFDGLIDDHRVYSRALSSSDITELYNDTGSGPQTFVVTNTNDSGAGSLRQAIINANANVGADTIEFDITGSGTQVIGLSSSLDAITEQVTIDGTTQTGWIEGSFLPIVIDGNGVSFDGLSFSSTADGSEVRGLVVRDVIDIGIEVDAGSDNITIAGNWLGTFNSDGTDAGSSEENGVAAIRTRGDATIIGGSIDADRNVISGNTYGVIVRGSSTNTTVSGNYIGTDITGNALLGSTAYGIFLQDDVTNNTIGGSTTAHRNVIAGASDYAIRGFVSENIDNNTIQNNYIGVSADGLTNLGNASGIVFFGGGDNNQILDNTIVGSTQVGIEIGGDSTGNIIQGNFIGTDATETYVWGNGEHGILLKNNADNNTIGGIGAGEGNVIAHSGQTIPTSGAGISVRDTSTGNSIRGNSIYNNAGIGIDLTSSADDGADANDSGDSDSGGNTKQNHAELTAASISDAGSFGYTLNTDTMTAGTYTVDFYASTDFDGGEVEGARYLGSLTGVTGDNGVLSGSLSSITLAVGEYVTSVTTDSSGNSSEFSAYALAVDGDVGGSTPSDLQATATNGGGLSINDDGGNDVYLLADDGSALLGGLEQLSFETQFSTTRNSGNTVLISYATDNDSNEIMLWIDAGGSLRAYIGGDTVSIPSTTFDFHNLRDGSTHTLGITWDGTSGQSGAWEMFLDGQSLGSGTGLAADYAIESGGTLLFGQEQDSLEGGFNGNQQFSGTIYNNRLFSDIRTDAEMAASYASELPFDEDGMIAQWQFGNLSSDGVVTETVSGNNLTVKHINESGFTASEPTLTFLINENPLDGTVVGQVHGVDAEREAQIASLLASNPNLIYSAKTGKFYEAIASTDTFSNSETAAAGNTLNTVAGQLVAIRSATEQEIVAQLAADVGAKLWLGGSDETLEGEWRWQANGVDQDQFWKGDGDGYNTEGAYENWFSGKPDSGAANENYAVIRSNDGLWDDELASDSYGHLVQWSVDEVLDATQALTYSIGAQTAAGAFAIDDSTGVITIADGSLLDYEDDPSHTLTIRTTDIDGNFHEEDFTISLNNLAESNNAPTGISSGIELNADGGNDAYLIADNGGAILGNASQLTVEIAFSTQASDQSNLISYVGGPSRNDLQIVLQTDGTASINIDNSVRSGLSGIDYNTLRDGEIHTVSLSWDNTQGNWALYVDGEMTDHGTGLSQGGTLNGSSGTGGLVFGQEQDSVGGNFNNNEIFSGTLYDVRIWDEVRSEAEISMNYQHKFDSSSLPNGLVANWQMDGFNGSSEVVDVVSGNNLSVGHASGGGFTASTPVDDLHISENANNGDSVGFVVPSDPIVHNDLVSDGLFLETDPSGYTTYSDGQTFGSWSVVGQVALNDETVFEASPLGGYAVELGTSSSAGAIEQILTTEVGRIYQIVFVASADWDASTDPKELRVSAGGSSEDFVVERRSDWDYFNLGWEHRTFTFTAESTTTTLNLASLEGNSVNSAIVGDIQVIEIPAAITTILNDDPTLSYDAATGKFYRFIETGTPFDNALSAATGDSINGVSGQLVTIRSAYENELIRQFALDSGQDIWLGTFDTNNDGNWNWLEGNTESSDQFWTGGSGGSAATGFFAPTFGQSEISGEDYARLKTDGTWDDSSEPTSLAYVVEWDASEVLANFTFSLTDASNNFEIDANSGEITVAATNTLNYETGTSHEVDVTVTDAAGNSHVETMTIVVDNFAEAAHTVPGPQSVNEDEVLTFSGGNAVSVTDTVPGTDAPMQVTLSVNDGVLDLFDLTGITIIEGTDGSGTITFNGTESAINTALAGMTFTPDANFNGSVTLNITTSMGADLAGHYSFDAGTAIDDSAGPSQDGTLNGDATTITDPERGEVLSLDGTGDFVEINSEFNRPANATLAAWVNFTTVGSFGGEVISIGNALVLRMNSSMEATAIHFDGTSFIEIASGVNVGDGSWHHLAFTYNDAADTQTLYVDGVSVATGSFAGSIDYANSVFTNTRIGDHVNASDSNFDFNGLIDEARIYDRALSSAEIQALASDQTEVTGSVAITVNAVNDAPVVSGPGSVYSFIEQGSLNIHGTGFSVTDVDDNGGTMTATLTVGEGRLLFDAGNSGVTIVSGNSTDTVTITGTETQINELLDDSSTGTIVYHNDQTVVSDTPSTSTTITLTVNDQGNTGTDPGDTADGSSEEGSASQTINITAVNDGPLILGPELIVNGDISTGDDTGWTRSTFVDFSGGEVVFGGGNTPSPHFASQTISTIAGETYLLEFDYRDSSATSNQQMVVTVDGTTNLLTTEAIVTDTDGSTFVRYRYTFTADSGSTTITFTDTSDDVGSMSNDTTSVDGRLDNISVQQSSGELGTLTITEGDGPTILYAASDLFDAELSADDDLGGMTVNVNRAGGANANDSFSATGLLGTLTGGQDLVYNSNIVGSVSTNLLGALSFTFNSGVDNATVNDVFSAIAYTNTSQAPESTYQIAITANDGNSSDTQGSGGAAFNSAYITVDMTPVNDVPVIADLHGDTLLYDEGDGVVVVDQGTAAAITDIDSADFAGGNLTVSSNTGGDNSEDQLSIRDQGIGVGQIGFDGTIVTYQGVQIGTASGGSNGADLVITLNANADAAATSALTQNITYENSDTINPTEDDRTISFTVNDGDGGISASSDVTIEIGRVNDAPQNGLQSNQSVPEDGTLVFSTGNGNNISVNDVDSGSSDIQVTLTVTNGIFTLAGTAGLTSFSGDGTTTVTIQGPNTAIFAALNGSSYTPAADYNGSATLTMATNDLANTGSGGAQTDTDVMNITVTAVNDAPVLDNSGTLTLDPIAEDAGPPSGSVGTLITDLVSIGGNVTDVDAGSQAGIAITAADTSNGSWWYTTDGGTNWNALGNVSDSSARALNANSNTRIYFEANTDFDGTVTDAITFRAWDRSVGSTGTLLDASTNGGTSAFSANTETADQTVTSVNDGPQLIGPSIVTNGTFTTDLTGWTAVDNVDGDGSQARFGQIGGANGTLSQTLTTEIGKTYVLSFDYGDHSATQSQSIDVDVVGGATLTNVSLTSGVADVTTPTYQYTFVADSTSTTITFGDTSADHSGARGYLDNVSVSTDAAPNPAITYTENDGAVVVDATIDIEDIDDTDIDSATIQITGNFLAAEDTLTFVDQNGITGSFNTTNGMLTLTGPATLAEFETALRSVTYTNTSEDPSTATRTVSFTINDGDADSNTQTRDIAITPVNDAPTLTNSAMVNLAGTNEDTVSAGSLVSSIFASAGGNDVDAGSLSGIAVTSTTGNGVWQYSTDGSNWTDFSTVAPGNALLLTSTTQVRYNPDGIDGETATFGFIGWDQTASSGSVFGSPSNSDPTGLQGGVNEFSAQSATASMVITSVNDAVIAVADTGDATEAGGINNATVGSNATGNVLANDTEVDPGDTLNVTGVATGTVASANTDVATGVGGTYGTITIAADGSYTYVVDDSNTIVQALRTSGDTITDTFTYTVTDSGGATSSTQILVTISGQNDAPVAMVDNAIAVEAGGLANADVGTNPTGNVLTNDIDVDSGDTKTVTGDVVGAVTGSIGASVAGSYGAITINSDGSYSYIVDNSNAAVEALRTSSDTLDDVFTYTMTDTDGATSSSQITVTIQGQNEDPGALDDDLTAVESGGIANATAGSNGTGNVLSNDADVDSGDTQTIVGVDSGSQSVASGNVGSGVAGTYGTLTIDVSGNATFVVNESNTAVQALRTVSDTLTEVFTYTMTDTAGADSTAEVTVTITGQNDAPVAVANTATAIEASGIHNSISGTDPTGNVLTNDTDVDAGDTKTVIGVATGVQASTTGNVGSTVTGSYGEITINSDGSYTYTVDNDNAAVEALLDGETLTETYSYTMSDTAGLESTTQIVITIDGRTDLPAAEADMDTSVESGGVANASAGTNPSGNVLANDAANDGKVVIGVDPGTTGTATGDVGVTVVGTYGSVVIDANGDFTYTLDNTNPAVEALRTSGDHVTDVFTYTMKDNADHTSTTQLTITVDGQNDAIVAMADVGTAVESGGLNNSSTGSDATGNLVSNDTDVDSGDTKTVTGVQLGIQASTSGSVGSSLPGNYGSIVVNNDGSYTYTINESLAAVQALRTPTDTLTETYSYTVSDTSGATSTTQVVITIQGGNDTPTAVVDTATAYEAGGVSNGSAGTNPTGNVLSNDTDVDAGDTQTVVGVAAGTQSSASGNVGAVINGSYGNITIASDGSYTYTVNNSDATVQGLRTSGQSLSDTFTYTFEDTAGQESTTQITVTVRGANDAIVAIADTMTATEAGGTANGVAGVNPTTNVLANDTDVDSGDTQTVAGVAAGIVSSATGSVGASVAGLYGSIQIASDGTATYTVDNSNSAVQALLNSGDTLTDVFTYTVADTSGAETSTQVTVTVEGANDAPVAVADTGTANESGGIGNATAGNNATGNVLTNDNQVDSGDSHTVTGVDTGVQTSTTGNVGVGVNGNYGTLTLDSSGTYTYVIDESNTDVEELRTSSDTLSEVFSYTIEDAAGLSSTTTLTITIQGANDTPVATFDTATAIEAGGVANGTAGTNPTGNVLSNDTDIDAGDSQNIDGVIAGVAGSASGNVGSDVVGTYGSINIAGNGSYTYTVDNSNAAIEALRNSSETLNDVFTYTMIDASGATSTTQISVTIQGANDDPVISIEAGDSAAELFTETNTTLTTSGTLTATDLDLTDIVTSTLTGVIASGTTTGLGSDNAALLAMLTSSPTVLDATEQTDTLTWNFNSAGETFDYLAVGESLTLTYTITVADLDGATDSQDIVITINGTNDTPDVTIGSGSAAESISETDTTLSTSGTLSVSDFDLSDSVSSNVSNLVTSGTTTGLASNNAALLAMLTSTTNVIDGTELSDTLTWNFNSASESFDYLADSESLTLTYTITVTDSQGATDTQDVIITINGTNDAPIVTIESGDSAAETLSENNTTLTTSGTLTTTDLDLSDTSTSTVSGVVASGTTAGLASNNAALLTMLTSTANVLDGTETVDQLNWNFNSASEAFDYLAVGESLTLTYTITVTDSQSATDTQDVVITINGTNDAPVAQTGINSAIEDGSVINGSLSGTDFDQSDTHTYSLITDTTEGSATVNPDGTYSFDPGTDFQDLGAGSTRDVTFVFEFQDNQGAASQETVTITVSGINDGPTAVSDNPIAVEAGGTLNGGTGVDPSGNVLTNDTDADTGDTQTVSGVAAGVQSSTSGNVASGVTGNYGTLTINSDGSYSYVIDNNNAAVESLRTPSETLDDVFSYTFIDSGSQPSTTQVTITIQGSNDNPHDLTAVGMTIDENSSFGQSVGSVTTSDVDGGESFTYSLSDSAGGRFAIDSSGNITVANPAGLDYEDEASHSIEIEVTDSTGGTYTETFLITLGDVDEFDVGMPVDIDGNANEVNEDTVGSTVGIVASAVDADGTNNTVTYFLSDDDGGRFAIDQATGIVTTAVALDAGTQNLHTIEVEARSSDGSSNVQTFSINVIDVNEAPIALGESYTLNASSSLNLGNPGILGNDIDNDGDSLSSIIETPPSNGTLTQLSDGSLVYTPDPTFFGTDSFTYRATDGSLQSNIATVLLTVEAVPPPAEPDPEPEPDSEPEAESESLEIAEGGGGQQAEDGEDGELDLQNKAEEDYQESQAIGHHSNRFGGFATSFANDPLSNTARSSSLRVIAGFDFQSDELLEEYQIVNRPQNVITARPVDWRQWEAPPIDEDMSYEFIIGSAGSAAGLFSIGYVLWALRGGAFFTAVASSMPSWRIVDPTAILSASRGGACGKDDDDDILG